MRKLFIVISLAALCVLSCRVYKQVARSSLNVVVRKTERIENPEIQDKVLICGVCRNTEKAVPNTIASIANLGSRFSNYRAIIYENNSTDQTKKLLSSWADSDPHIIFLSEQLSTRKIARQLAMKLSSHRTDKIARARNIVLDVAMDKRFDDFKYVIWADLDFLEPWDVDAIVETILHPQEEWDAVFANGAYDLFALRSPDLPIGYELIGSLYWTNLKRVSEKLNLDPEGSWQKVYSAFGGLGIYKRDAIRNCRYSGVVTQDLEKVATAWLGKARQEEHPLFLKEYDELLSSRDIFDLSGPLLGTRKNYPDEIGVRVYGGDLVWFSCTKNATLPWVCEHVPLHASMALKGHDRFFINPKIRVNP